MDVTERMLAEYRDLPGLRLTTRQAARLWALEHARCERLLNHLVLDGHLFIDATGQYGWWGRVHGTHAPRSAHGIRGGGLTTDANMQMTIQVGKHIAAEAAMPLRRRPEFGFGRFSPRPRQVVAGVTDVNGPRGGLDRSCVITLHPDRAARPNVIEDALARRLAH